MVQTILRVRDLNVSAAFYRTLPDFEVSDREGKVVFMVGPGGVKLVLAQADFDLSAWGGVHRSGPGAWVYLRRPDLPALAAEIGGEPVERTPGFWTLQATDPDGYVITFWESSPLPDAEVLEMYRAAPERLRAALAGLSEADLDTPWAPGKWTVRQIVHHLVDSDLSTFAVIRMALALPGREIHADLWNPDDWMAGLRCGTRAVEPAVALFEAAHAWVIEAMGALPDALDCWVSYPSGYRTDVRQLLRQVGGHALHHIKQMEETRPQRGESP